MTELEKVYDPKSVEKEVGQRWLAAGAFNADPSGDGEKFCIVIPPPNVTAALHLGHALNNTLQDVIVRWRRMQGFNALWMPGTDHAGIATQTVVEKRILAEEGKRRTELDPDPAEARRKFVARTQAWKDEYETRILNQLKMMGCSCDWRRTRFTMDEVCARAVREVFFKLFSDGLIYRGKRLVNWDPATQTVLADDEVEHEEVKGHFWYLKYPLEQPVVCSTGVSPVCSPGVPPGPASFEEEELKKRHGAHLPHWTKEGSTYAITFRLADSLPAVVAEGWIREREEILLRAKAQNRTLTYLERSEVNRLYSDRVQSLLDAGQGECLMKNPDAAKCVAQALGHFDGDRYELIAWAVMPNHVHAILKPLGDNNLSDIMHSWKSFTSKTINKMLGRTGKVWQEEYYDHLIRDIEDFNREISYVINNPVTAGLVNWPWVGTTEHGQDARATHGRDAHATNDRDTEAHATITHVTVATTRPETMLGDTAVAMNPADPRAKYLVGKMVRLPIVGRLIPIIADDHVVMPNPESDDEKAKFSTGFLKVTPAHDPDDYAIGQRHKLAMINIMAPDGSISDKHGWLDWDKVSKNADGSENSELQNLIGMDRFEAREAVVEFFRTEGLLEEVRDYVHQVGHSYRSHVPIEPYLSDQWYVAVKKPIADFGFRISELKDKSAATPAPGATAGLGATAASFAAVQAGLAEERDGITYIKGTDVPVNSLAGLALMPILDGRLKIVPDRYANNYRSWLENLRDWPISRQLWWGHQIPVWDFALPATYPPTAADCERMLNDLLQEQGVAGRVRIQPHPNDSSIMYICSANSETDAFLDELSVFANAISNDAQAVGPADQLRGPNAVPSRFRGTNGAEAISFLEKCVCDSLTRDPDVLDTWFSSALWPFSTLGWPEKNDALAKWYPGDVLITAREIITLWVSRMVMMGQYCLGDIPFHDVFIHAMIQDGEGRKMSKSLGNGIDPLDIIDSHGADAMRFTLCQMTTQTQDVRMPVEAMTLPDGRTCNTSPKFDNGRNYCNKLWNASRFVLMKLQGAPAWSDIRPRASLADGWILSRFNATVRDATAALENYRFNELADTLYHFMWDDFCDWYVEIAKARINAGQDQPKAILAHCLDGILRLLHPMAPFITEAIWQKLGEVAAVRGPGDQRAEPLLVLAAWPMADGAMIDPQAEERFSQLAELIRGIRNIRTQHNVPPSQKVDVLIEAGPQMAEILADNAELMKSLANVGELTISRSAVAAPADAAAIAGAGVKMYVLGIVDRSAEAARLTKQRETLEKGIRAIEGKLGNPQFVSKAPPALVEKERQRMELLKADLAAVLISLDAVNS